MLRKMLYLYSLLCPATLVRRGDENRSLQSVKDDIEKYVKIVNAIPNDEFYQKSKLNKALVEVYNSEPRYGTYIFNEKQQKMVVDKTYALCNVINCKFALWAVHQTSFFVNSIYTNRVVTEIYNSQSRDEFHESVFKQSLNDFIDQIRDKVVRAISVLTYFFEIYSDSSYYTDFGVLKSLISLNIKIDLMSSRNDDSQTHFKRFARRIVELLLIEIAELQRFLSMNNCDYGTSFDDKNISKIFGLWIALDKTRAEEDFDMFLLKMRNVGLKSDDSLKKCSTRHIFLENIVKIHEEDLISSMIDTQVYNYSNGDDTRTRSVRIEEIRERIEISYDIDVICWYHDFVLSAIVQTLHMFLSYTNNVDENTIQKIREIKRKTLENRNILPAYFVEGINKINNVVGDQSEVGNSTHYLDQLLTRILENFDDIVCARKYLKNIIKENYKYHTPGSPNSSALRNNLSGVDETKNESYTACRFVSYVYAFSFRAQVVINEFNHQLNSKLSKSGRKEIKNIFDTVLNYFLLVYKHEKVNYHFIQIAYNLATILKNQLFNSNVKGEIIFFFERILNIIMTKLDIYRLKYCSYMQNGKYLLYKNINYLKTVTTKTPLEDFMHQFFVIRYRVAYNFKTSNPGDIFHSHNVHLFEIDYLYKTFVQKNRVIALYGNVIKIYWNGQCRSIKNIFSDARKMIFNPQNINALYDVYNKFFLAVIFFEVYDLSLGNDYNTSKEGLKKIMNELKFDECHKIFPVTLTSFISDLNTIFHFSDVEGRSDALSVLKQTRLQIEEKFKESSFVITYNRDNLSFPILLYMMGYNFNTLLHEEIDTTVKEFNTKFQNIYSSGI